MTIVKGKEGQPERRTPRIYEFIQGVNGQFSNKRLLSYFYALAAVTYAFLGHDSTIVAIFAAASGATSISGVFEKKQ